METSIEQPVCAACLSSDRKCALIGDTFMLLLKLLVSESIQPPTKLCWECHALLRKVEAFQTKVRTADRVLRRKLQYNTNLISQSTLKCEYKNKYDLIITENKNDLTKCEENLFEDHSFDDNVDVLFEDKIYDFDIAKVDFDPTKDNFVATKDHFDATKDNFDATKDEFDAIKDKNTSTALCDIERKSIKRRNKRKSSVINKLKNYTVYKLKESKFKNYIRPVTIDNEANLNKERVKTNLDMKKSITTHERNMCKDSSSNEEISTPQDCTFHYKCDLCKSNFSSEKIIRHHLKCHKEIYKCNQCKVMFASLKEVIEHFQDLHSRCCCDLCGKEYVSKKRLIRHMLVHEKQECNICHREFVTRTKLLRHKYNVHGLYIKKKAGPPNLEEAYCVECDKQFSSAPALKKHLYSSVRHGGYKQKSVPCPECGKVFVRRGYMQNHRRLFHSRDDRHRCDACGKRFVSAFTVRQHRERVHERRAPPRDKLCADCGRGFATNRILIQHIRTHTGERPFACPQCPARFRQKYSAQTHFRSQHAGKDDALPVLAP